MPAHELISIRTIPDIRHEPGHKPDSEEKLDLNLWDLGKFFEDVARRHVELDLQKDYQGIIDTKKYMEKSLSHETLYFIHRLMGLVTDETEKRFVDWYFKGSKSDYFQSFILSELSYDYILTALDIIITKISDLMGETNETTIELTDLCRLRHAEYMIAKIRNGEFEQIQVELGIKKKQTEEERKAKFYKDLGF